MTTQLCECSSRECREVVAFELEQVLEIRKNPNHIMIAKSCKKGPEPTDVLVDEGSDFYVYAET